MDEISDEVIRVVMETISDRPFHTSHFVEGLKVTYPQIWRGLVATYGEGGRGAGSHFTANSAVSQALHRASERRVLDKLEDYGDSPPELNWGSPSIRYWTDAGGDGTLLPGESPPNSSETYPEGAAMTVVVNRYERNPTARAKCIAHHGSACKGCGFDFGARYGDHGKDFIHVHHIVPLHTVEKGYEVDPISDLVPVCPNCHAMIHRQKMALSMEELRRLLR
ncbi:MAG: HNH endonuclease [Rhizobiales bacterium]|nr:HNH endonuclease [Hyphomicrobiales bacterium]